MLWASKKSTEHWTALIDESYQPADVTKFAAKIEEQRVDRETPTRIIDVRCGEKS